MSQAKGFDESHHQQGGVNYAGAMADGYAWVICRSSHGRWKDATFLPNVAKAKAAGFVIGAYHYIYVVHGHSQVQSMIEQARATDDIDTPLFLDVERYDNTDATVAQWRACINANVKLLEDNGFEVGFYTSYWAWNRCTGNMSVINGKPAEDYMMWVAHWSEVTNPSLPIPWNKDYTDWEFWQQGSDLRPTWYPGRIDYGVYNGTPQQLREKYLGEPPPPDTHTELWAAISDLQGKFTAIKKAI